VTRKSSAPQESEKGLVALGKDHDGICSMAWSPNGKYLATGSLEERVLIWDVAGRKRFRTFTGHVFPVTSLAWSPTGGLLAAADRKIRIYDVANNYWVRMLASKNGHVNCLAWSPCEEALLASGVQGHIEFWDLESFDIRRSIGGLTGGVTSIAWSPNGTLLAAGSGGELWIYDAASLELLKRTRGDRGRILSLAWSADGRLVASGSDDDTIRIWNTTSWQNTNIIEGHTGGVERLSFSNDGAFLASRADDVRVWRCDTWEAVLSFKSPRIGFIPAGPSFSPGSLTLATLGGIGREVHVQDLDKDAILSASPVVPSLRYTNAKAVLIGDTGVGKSALGIVLAREPYRSTDSTHARHVWTLESKQVNLSDGRTETRELLLCDLAGQPGYRLVHQLHLNDVSVALVVFDARSETDPFSGVQHWDRALRQAVRVQLDPGQLKKYLVAARVDRGSVGVSRARVLKLVHELGFEDYIETSAREGKNIDSLREAISKAIDWEALPKVSSNELFRDIMAFIVDEKDNQRVLTTIDELYRSYLVSRGLKAAPSGLRSQFMTCVGRVESRDLVKRLSFGDLILLQPERLDNYASAIVNAAKDEPDGLGCISEQDVRAARFTMSADERLVDQHQEALLLIATIEGMIRQEIALREPTNEGSQLVLPSQITKENPALPNPPGKAAVISFEGPVIAAYAILSVRLCRSSFFRKREMWKNAIEFDANAGGNCGLALREVDEGRGELTLFFGSEVSKETRGNFIEFVESHLENWTLPNSVKKRDLISCGTCEFDATEQLLDMLAKQGRNSFSCPNCGSTVSLAASATSVEADPLAVSEMDRAADAGRDKETAASILVGKRATKSFDVFLCHNSIDKPAVADIGELLKRKGILPWLDKWEIAPGQRWQRELDKQIKNVKSAAIFLGENGIGPWQDLEQEALIRRVVSNRCSVIPVILPSCKRVPELPTFLEGLNWVDFRKAEPDPMDQLIWGITGKLSR
jgi:small GTP-binding protein